MDRFLYDSGFRHERVKCNSCKALFHASKIFAVLQIFFSILNGKKSVSSPHSIFYDFYSKLKNVLLVSSSVFQLFSSGHIYSAVVKM